MLLRRAALQRRFRVGDGGRRARAFFCFVQDDDHHLLLASVLVIMVVMTVDCNKGVTMSPGSG